MDPVDPIDSIAHRRILFRALALSAMLTCACCRDLQHTFQTRCCVPVHCFARTIKKFPYSLFDPEFQNTPFCPLWFEQADNNKPEPKEARTIIISEKQPHEGKDDHDCTSSISLLLGPPRRATRTYAPMMMVLVLVEENKQSSSSLTIVGSCCVTGIQVDAN